MNKQNYRELVNKIKENLEVQDGSIKEKNIHAVYDQNLPDGITPDMIKTIAEYNKVFMDAAYTAVGEIAAELFKNVYRRNVVNTSIGFFGPGDTINIIAEIIGEILLVYSKQNIRAYKVF